MNGCVMLSSLWSAPIVLCFAEENLTYAELELIKPHRAAKGIPTSTVYAQILFEENKL